MIPEGKMKNRFDGDQDMPTVPTYPMTITPLSEVTRKRDRQGRGYLSFRAEVDAGEGRSQRTVRAFGAKVAESLPMLRKGVAVKGRFSFDSFTGGDGSHSQTLRIASLAA